MLEPGTPAPPFALSDDQGRTVRLADFRGSWVLLWWFPKAATPGCTVEGQALRDRAHEFDAAGCVVLGVSFDTPQDNRCFAVAQGFTFALLSDTARTAGRDYMVVRDPDDQYVAFPKRCSYLIDPHGVIRRSYRVADVGGHAEQVLADLAELAAS